MNDRGKAKQARKEQVAFFLASLDAGRTGYVEDERKYLLTGNCRYTGKKLSEVQLHFFGVSATINHTSVKATANPRRLLSLGLASPRNSLRIE